MHQGTGSETLKILVVTEDRALARELSRFLSTVGYQVLQAAESHSALAAVEARWPQILILCSNLASRSNWELCRLLSERQPSGGLFRFLMVEEPEEAQLLEALEAGVDDFLLMPVGHGELLSRLRAAARVLEFDRRVSQQGRVDAVTGLLSQSAFVGQLRHQWPGPTGTQPRVACVVLDVDFFERINHSQGATASSTLLKAVAQELNNLRVGSEILGSLGGDRFCAMLPGANDTAAVDWAERARQVLAATKFKFGKTTWQITASFGVSSCDSAENAEQLIDQAMEALQVAKSSGRNCVARWSEFGVETNELSGLDKLFDRTVARDVMTPCAVVLRPDEDASHASEMFHRTRLESIPVVNADGTLEGVCHASDAAGSAGENGAHRQVRDLMTTKVQLFEQSEDFATLLQFFTQDPLALAVVVDESRPVGILTCDSLLALSKPVTSESLAPKSQHDDSSEYLLVPDPSVGECEPAA